MTAAAVANKNGTAPVHDFDKVLAEIETDGDGDRSVSFVFKGREFHIPAPLDWSDDVVEEQAAAQAGRPNPVRLATAFLGADEYAEFKKLGGNAMRFMKFFEKVMGGTPGESSAS